MKKIILVLCSFLLLGTVLVSCGGVASKLEMIATEASKQLQLPRVVGAGVRLDKLEAVGSTALKYHYTLTDMVKEDVNIDEYKRITKSVMVNGLKSNADKEFFVKNNISNIFSYSDKNGDFVFDLELTADDIK